MGELKILTPEQKEFYKKNGYLKIGGIYTEDEMKEITEAYDELFARKQLENSDGLESAWIGDRMEKEAGYINYTVKSIHNLQMHNAAFTRLITNPRMLDVVEDILETQDILLHHTKAHVKPPENGAPYLMHQDYPYFPHRKHTMLAVFLHLDDTTPENGGLAVYPGSHKLGPLPNETLTKAGEMYHYVDQDRFPLSGASQVDAKKGEIVVFSYLLLHGSYLNTSTRVRRMFLTQLRAADDSPVKDNHKSACQNLVLRGKNVNLKANMATRFTDRVTNA